MDAHQGGEGRAPTTVAEHRARGRRRQGGGRSLAAGERRDRKGPGKPIYRCGDIE